jgi:hypothetical protein
MKWQPIETAPKDGTVILLCSRFGVEDAFASWWIQGDLRWANSQWAVLDYWMPLPELPKE